MKPIRHPAWLLLLLGLALPAAAGAFSCSITVTPLTFGSYDVFDPKPRDATSSINISCNAPPQNPNAPIPVTLTLSPGNSGSFAQRQMLPLTGSLPLLYNLFTDPSFSSVLGDGSGGSQLLTRLLTRNNPWAVTVYGRIPPLQNLPPGAYSDTLTATILW